MPMKFTLEEYQTANAKLEEVNEDDRTYLEFYDGLVIPRQGSEPIWNLDIDFLINFFNTNNMTGSTSKHSSLSSQMNHLFRIFTDENENYEVFDSGMQVVLDKIRTYLLPDVTVVESATKIIINEQLHNPLIAIEILSKGTQKKDRTIKKEAYLSCESLKDYVMIDQYSLHIEHHFRTEAGWQTEIYTNIEDSIAFAGISLVLAVNKIYKNVKF
ncbi:MAG: Uma2 family endonuclease [Bacteroidetes bacterium]|nr:MAG: Uma2 family endonuclease [Bacteroidota bacterium]